MAQWRYFGHAHADPSQPTAAGICDRCNYTWQLSQLKWQYEWRGESLVNTQFRVCPRCIDTPAQFLKAIILPADPVPVPYPRPNQFLQQENSVQATNWDPATNPPITTIRGQWDDGVSVWL